MKRTLIIDDSSTVRMYHRSHTAIAQPPSIMMRALHGESGP
jgi:hypothetical protein